jgi:hypothetical protein
VLLLQRVKPIVCCFCYASTKHSCRLVWLTTLPSLLGSNIYGSSACCCNGASDQGPAWPISSKVRHWRMLGRMQASLVRCHSTLAASSAPG